MKTYAELLAFLQTLSPEELAQTATVSCDIMEESFAINYFHKTQKGDMLDGVLDKGHIVLAISA